MRVTASSSKFNVFQIIAIFVKNFIEEQPFSFLTEIQPKLLLIVLNVYEDKWYVKHCYMQSTISITRASLKEEKNVYIYSEYAMAVHFFPIVKLLLVIHLSLKRTNKIEGLSLSVPIFQLPFSIRAALPGHIIIACAVHRCFKIFRLL